MSKNGKVEVDAIAPRLWKDVRLYNAERSIELSMSLHGISQELAQKLARIHPMARMTVILYFIGYSAGRFNFELTYSERCYGKFRIEQILHRLVRHICPYKGQRCLHIVGRNY